MNWSAFPIARAGIFFISGILLKPFLPEVDIWILFAFFLVFMFSGLSKNISISTFIKSVAILLMSFALGILWHEMKIRSLTKENLPESNCEIECILLENPVKKSNYRAFVKVQFYKSDGGILKTSSAKLILYFSPQDSLVQIYKAGDKIIASGKISMISNTGNPGAFDMKKFYFRKGFTLQAYISIEDHRLVGRNHLGFLTQFTSQIREKWLYLIDSFFLNIEIRAIIKALLLGFKDELSEDVFQSFSETGAIHVLAVSGLHIGAVLYLFVLAFRWIPLKGWGTSILKPFVLIIMAILFVFLTGASPSVIRAAIMFSMVLIGKEWFRNADTINVLFISAIWILLYDPFLVYNLSFQFSYLSLLSIIIFYPYCKMWYIPVFGMSRYIWDLMAVSIAAQFLVVPLALYYFNQFPVYFILSNIFAVPLALMLVYCGFALLLSETFWPGHFRFLVSVYNGTTEFFLEGIRYIHSLPYAVIQNIWIQPYQVILMYAGIFCVVVYLSTKKIGHLYYSLFFIFSVCLGMYVQDFTNSGIQKVCIYETRKGFMIDFMLNQTTFVLKSAQISAKSEKFIASKNRIMHGVQGLLYIQDTLDYTGNIFSKVGNTFRLNEIKFYLLHQDFINHDQSLPIDYLLVPPEMKSGPSYILSFLMPGQIILLSSVKNFHIEQWKLCAQEYSIPVLDLTKEGYYELPL